MSKSLFTSLQANKFKLPEGFRRRLVKRQGEFGWDGFGEVVYLRTYARDHGQGVENWGQTVARVTEGTFSILKNHLLSHRLEWNQNHWSRVAQDFAETMFKFHWSPPGRGLWAMGTTHVDQHGSMALNNCGFVDTTDLIDSASWAMDALMKGVGVGFNTSFKGQLKPPTGIIKFTVPDTREGWVESVRVLLQAYHGGLYPHFDYSQIRPAGSKIHGFGGTTSGYKGLEKLHQRINLYCCLYLEKEDQPWLSTHERDQVNLTRGILQGRYTSTRLTADLFNAIGACIVASGVRRSSQIALGDPSDSTFLSLKDMGLCPERADIYWNSNNSAVLSETNQFHQYLPDLADRIRRGGNGEPGLLNLVNVQKYGRVKSRTEKTREHEPDRAIGINPCGEIPLESYELCNVVETFPSKCIDSQRKFQPELFKKACENATLYATIVSLLPTDSPKTNQIIARNHRIGVSVSGTSALYESHGYSKMINILRQGHETVRQINSELAALAGVPSSLRVTTVKPSGTISKLAGVSEGLHFPLMGRYILRRMRVAESQPIANHLINQGIPYEKDGYADNTLVFEFPVDQGPSRTIDQVSIWEQLKVAELHQRWWSENSCSATFMYTSQEAKQLEEVISTSIPNLKSMSFAPHSDIQYAQAPVERISREEYLKRKEVMVNFSLKDFDGQDTALPLFCDGGACEIEK